MNFHAITVIKLPDSETVEALNDYNFLLSSILKKMVLATSSIGGYTNYLSMQSLKTLHLKNELCSFINFVVIKLPLFGVYSGYIVSSLLLKVWSHSMFGVEFQKVTSMLVDFRCLLDEVLTSLKYKCDVLNVMMLQNALKNILNQEPALLLSNDSLNNLSLEIIKGVLADFNSDSGLKVDHIFIYINNGSDYFFMINGVICEIDELMCGIIKKVVPMLVDSNKMLLFVDMLYDSDILMTILQFILDNDIKLILCQKKMSDLSQLMFRRNNVVVVERVGMDTAKQIEKLTGCVPIYSLDQFNTNNLISKVGYFSKLDLKSINHLNYIVIESSSIKIFTLYVRCRCFGDLSCMKEIFLHCIKLINCLCTNPYLLPGPIQFEEKLHSILKKKLVDYKTPIISCFCDILDELIIFYNGRLQLDLMDPNVYIGDIYHLKKNALMTSIDEAINLFSVGAIVRKQ